MSEVTRMLEAVERGEPHAAEELLPLVYEELRRLASYQLAHESPGQTLQATALVHEAYQHLIGNPDQQWNGTRHFFLAAAQAMRHILIDAARRKRAACHGDGLARVNVECLQLATAMAPDELLAVDDALEKLAQVDASAAELVRLRFYAGLDHGQTAEVLGVSRRSARRSWQRPVARTVNSALPSSRSSRRTPIKKASSTGT